MKKGLWKRRAFAFLVAAAMVIPQGVYAAETEGNETPENAITEEVPERVHKNGCTLPSDNEGDCVTEPARVHEDGCILAPDQEGDCVTEPVENTEEPQEKEPEEDSMLESNESEVSEAEEQEEMPVKAPEAGDVLTVGVDVDAKYNSLVEAVNAANASDKTDITIELLSDMKVTECARITDKNITIDGNDNTITRGDSFNTIQDDARSTYNPAMIEVTTPKGKGASLTLENITLNDAGKYEGKIFAQASDGEDKSKNSSIVQDAIVAAYGTDTATAEIILGKGAVLKNFGGMSAVRVTGGATLTMENNSEIYDDTVKNRVKGEEGSVGPAGAVWVQGTEATMEEGAKIYDVIGRAFYIDGTAGDGVNINGTISNITGDKDMWQGQNGAAIHLRGGAVAHLNGDSRENPNSGKIEGIQTSGTSAVFMVGSEFYMNAGSSIRNCGEGVKGISEFGNIGNYLEMDGEITGIQKDNAININVENSSKPDVQPLICKIGPNGDIHENSVKNGAIYMQTVDGVLDIYGKIRNNRNETDTSAGGLYMAHNHKHSTVTMYDGAEISNNTALKYGGLIVSKGTFIMKGGTISGNSALKYGGVYVRNSGSFIMNGGSITNNTTTIFKDAGLSYEASVYGGQEPNVKLNNGEISENKVGGKVQDIAVLQNGSSHINRNMSISSEMNIGNPDIYLEKYNVVLKNPADIDVKFGNASSEVIRLLRASDINGWSIKELASLWCQDASGSVELLMSKPSGIVDSMPVYAAVVATDETGNALTDASVVFYNVTEKANGLNIAFPAPNATGYAVALVQPTKDYGTMNITAPNAVTMEDGAVIDYTVTYEMSENLANRLAAGENLENITMNVRFDKNVNIDPGQITYISDMLDKFNATYTGDTLTVTCSMKENWQSAASKNVTLKFAADASELGENAVVTASGDFNGEFERQDVSPEVVFVPANAVQTQLVAKESCVTVKLADMIVYMGGEQGFDHVVNDENGQVESSSSLPEPGFIFELPDGININEIRFVEETSGKTWQAVPYDGESTRVYKLKSGINQEPVRVEFTKDDGTKVVSDEFKVGDVLNQKLHMAIYKGAVGTVVAKVGNDKYPIIGQDATLEVRGTTNQVKYADVSANPTLQVGVPALKADSNTTFTINAGDVFASKDGIALLFDNIIENTASENNRTELLKDRAKTELNNSYNECAFDLKYLDLVDRHNGNTWVKASKDVTVYWPYPEGTDKTTEFELLHFEDLHRDMSNNEVAGDIASCKVSPVKFTKLDDHIEFKIGSGGFSPFALVWDGKASDGGSSGGSHTSNTYYVRYHNDDDTVKDGKFIPGETVTVKGNVFTAPVGKVLAGWSLDEDGKVDYKVGDTFRMPGSSVDLYAVWKDAETESHSAYISGYPDGTVGPDKTITRAEAATMFYNLLADKNGDTKAFTDVPANQWYAKAVMTLAGKGVISGYPDGTFKPNAPITRAEFVTMAMNFANAGKGTACSFPDVPQNMWYYGAIAGATQNGWISGYPDGTFGPDRYITRAEVTSVINRMENRAADMSFMMEHLGEMRTFSDLGFGHWAYGSMMEAANGHDYTRADQNSYESWVDIH